MNFTEKIQYVFQLPLERKAWLAVFFTGSLLCWFAIRLVNSRWLAGRMGDQYLQNRTLCVLTTEEQALKASRMGKLMHSVSSNVPWESKCLTESLCVKWLLNRYRIPAVLYLGARINSDTKNNSQMQAHAWLSVGPYIVTGAPEHLNYQVVATFVSPVMEAPKGG